MTPKRSRVIPGFFFFFTPRATGGAAAREIFTSNEGKKNRHLLGKKIERGENALQIFFRWKNVRFFFFFFLLTDFSSFEVTSRRGDLTSEGTLETLPIHLKSDISPRLLSRLYTHLERVRFSEGC